MSIEAELREETDRWERRERLVYRAIPVVLLVLITGITLMQPLDGGEVDRATTLVVVAAAATWLALLYVAPERWRARQSLMIAHFVVLMAISALLISLAPWYGSFAFVGYLHAAVYLRGVWRYLGVGATAMIMAGSYLGGYRFDEAEFVWAWLVLSLIGGGIGGVFVYFTALSERRNQQQRRAMVELHAANQRLEDALAENAGLHAQLLKQAREAGVLDERQRMAREIHDTLAQSLAGVLTQLQAAEQTLGGTSTAQRHVETAVQMARTSLAEARRTVHAVEPELLAHARLPDAISDVAGRWSEANRIDAVLTTTGDPRPMHAEVEVTLLRTAQEALANVAKHADAEQVRLTLSYMPDVVTLDVRDDGVGFDPDAKRETGAVSGGFGLAGMRQRVQRLAGSLAIESEQGEGTAISVSVPAIPVRSET
ncbi:sensor histidine kinase [Agromyces laixinhei]|uniref:sensor histidine kinase n=1 Tax=Agromyces laixinhei TaxID=2585717 RepID=UPI0012ECE096|nr:sensor histidine kinase [Agromyces laixinhei]